MVFVAILLIVCLAVPLIFILRKSLDEAKEQNNPQNETNNPTTNNSIFSRMANDLSVIKFWIQLFAIIQIIAFIIGIILVAVQCS